MSLDLYRNRGTLVFSEADCTADENVEGRSQKQASSFYCVNSSCDNARLIEAGISEASGKTESLCK